MKEFIDKLIERLEEIKAKAKPWDFGGVCLAIEIVNELAEEYKDKRSTVERLAIANTLIDSVRQELKNDLLTTALDKCMVDITACIDLLGIQKGD